MATVALPNMKQIGLHKLSGLEGTVHISFPEYFGSLQSARLFCMEFFTWYNGFHLHSKLDYVTPMKCIMGYIQVFMRKGIGY